MKTTYGVLLCLVLLVAAPAWAGDEVAETGVASQVASQVDGQQAARPVQFVVSYLYMNRRCATCKKLEAYANEAISSGFAEQLKDGSLVWRTVNFEEEANKHLADDYGLYSQSLIISKLQDGEEIRWKNLNEIWPLVSNKDGFVSYVQSQVKSFMDSEDKALKTAEE